MAEHHNISGLTIDGQAITRVQSISWQKVGAGEVVIVDGSGAQVTKIINPTAVQGQIVVLDSVQAGLLETVLTTPVTITYNVLTDGNVSKAVTIVNAKTGAIRSGQNDLTSAGPYVIGFGADSVSTPAA